MLLFTQRQQRIQKDRLMNDFSAALNNFQVVQRRAAERERESVARARAGSRLQVTILAYKLMLIFVSHFLNEKPFVLQVDELSQDEQLVTFEK